MGSVLSLHKAAVQDDIVAGLRSLADSIERGEVGDMPVITTCVVALGHSSVTSGSDDCLLHDVTSDMYSWGPRKDVFTVRGLLATILKDN